MTRFICEMLHADGSAMPFWRQLSLMRCYFNAMQLKFCMSVSVRGAESGAVGQPVDGRAARGQTSQESEVVNASFPSASHLNIPRPICPFISAANHDAASSGIYLFRAIIATRKCLFSKASVFCGSVFKACIGCMVQCSCGIRRIQWHYCVSLQDLVQTVKVKHLTSDYYYSSYFCSVHDHILSQLSVTSVSKTTLNLLGTCL